MNIYQKKTWASLVFILLLWTGTSAAQDPEPLFNAVTTRAAARQTEMKSTVRRERMVGVDFGLFLKPADVTKGTSFSVDEGMVIGKGKKSQKKRLLLNLFEDQNLILNLEQVENASPDGDTLSWFGRVEGIPESEVILVNSDDVISGNIALPGGRFFQVRYVSPGVHAIRDIDQSGFPPENHPRGIEMPPDEPSHRDAPSGTEPEISGDTIGEGDEPAHLIDVMVLYTPAARTAAGGTAAMNTLIDLAVTETNQGYINSAITQRIRLVHRAEVDYTETAANAYDNALDDLTGKNDGKMDEIHVLRDIYKTDMVSLFIDDSEWCGIAWVMGAESHDFEDSAFSVVWWDCAAGYYSFAHEMGHNQGGRHDIAHSSSDGVFEYSHGYQDPSGDFRTIMAYNCPGGCTRINYWSNTVVTYGGEAMGNTTKADMRQSHNNTYDTVAGWRIWPATVYVDHAWTGIERGTEASPFNTVTEGINAVVPGTQGGHIHVSPGTYTESLTIDKPVTFHTWGTGPIIIE